MLAAILSDTLFISLIHNGWYVGPTWGLSPLSIGHGFRLFNKIMIDKPRNQEQTNETFQGLAKSWGWGGLQKLFAVFFPPNSFLGLPCWCKKFGWNVDSGLFIWKEEVIEDQRLWVDIDRREVVTIRKYAFTVNFLLQSKGTDQTLLSSTFVREN